MFFGTFKIIFSINIFRCWAKEVESQSSQVAMGHASNFLKIFWISVSCKYAFLYISQLNLNRQTLCKFKLYGVNFDLYVPDGYGIYRHNSWTWWEIVGGSWCLGKSTTCLDICVLWEQMRPHSLVTALEVGILEGNSPIFVLGLEGSPSRCISTAFRPYPIDWKTSCCEGNSIIQH